ncbi:MAG: DUF445 family protein [Clostridia bacterium]|nr:DUF445 family protein [Clostridia bacterium]
MLMIVVPLLGALIGWLTNKIAIMLIFRPYKPIKIPILNYSIEGLLPKRRSRIAIDIGKMVEQDLLPVDDLLAKLTEPQLQKRLIEGLAMAIYQHLLERCPVALPLSVRNVVFQQVKEVVRREAPSLLYKLTASVQHEIKEQVSFQELVREKIEALEIRELEKLLVRIVSKELKHIEILGGILGFMIGLIQVLVIMAIG